MKVLLADETRAIRNLYRAVLRDTRYAAADVQDVANGLEALHWIRTGAHEDDLIVADWDLPEINGLSLMEHLRAMRGRPGLAILFCVNRAQIPLAEQAVRLGARGYLVRPFSDQDLRDKIQSLGAAPAREGSDVFKDIVTTVRAQENLPFLMSLPSVVIAELFRKSQHSTYAPGASLVRVGDRIESLSFVTAGEVEVLSPREFEGTELKGPGECYAERAFICGEPSKVSVRARTLVERVTISKEDMVDLARRHGAIRNFLNALLTRRSCAPVGANPEPPLCGTLRSLPFPDLLQFLSASRKTGALLLEEGGQQGEIYLEQGEVTDARSGDARGEVAFFGMASWLEASFVFRVGESSDTKTVRQSTMKLLMDAFVLRESPEAVTPALAG